MPPHPGECQPGAGSGWHHHQVSADAVDHRSGQARTTRYRLGPHNDPIGAAAGPLDLGLTTRPDRRLSEVVPVYAGPEQGVCGVDSVAAQRSHTSY